MTDERMPAERLVEGYEVLFPPLMRAALRACLEHARLTREDCWPTIIGCLDFAKLFGVPGAELAAFFGYLSYREGGRTVWVDALRGDVPSWTARQRATREQAMAFGFQCAFREVSSAGPRIERGRPRGRARLAGAGSLDPDRPPPVERTCLSCRKPFGSEGAHNRLCPSCANKAREASPFAL